MIKKQKSTEVPRQEIPVINADPEQGLTGQQVRQRTAGGWSNGLVKSAARTEKEIILENCLTFFSYFVSFIKTLLHSLNIKAVLVR